MNDTTNEDARSTLVARIEELEKARTGTKPQHSIKTLPLNEVATEPEVFQPRHSETLNEHHISDLMDGIKRAQGSALDPISVIQIDGSFYVVDGHHRLEAYRRKRVSKVPVAAFKGTVKEAIASGGRENGKARLPMGQSERSELGWRFVSMGPAMWSKAQIAEMAGVSTSLVGMMRRTWKEMGSPSPEERGHWWMARQGIEADLNTDERETWVDEQAARMAERMGKAMGSHMQKNDEITSRALLIVLGHKAEAVANSMAEFGDFPLGRDEFDENEGAF